MKERQRKKIRPHRRKVSRRKMYIKWENIGFSLLFVFLGSYAFGLLPIRQYPVEKPDTSIHTNSTSDTPSIDSSESDSSSSAPPVKEMRVTLSEEEFSILVLAVQHECGIDETLYLTIAERNKYNQLLSKNTQLTSSEAMQLDFLQKEAEKRLNASQQRCAGTMVFRIGKLGFGEEGFVTPGYRAKNLKDVLSQPGQFSLVDDYGNVVFSLLDDISNWQNLPTAEQFNPNDERTIRNIRMVLDGTADLPDTMVYEVRSNPDVSYEEAEAELKARYSDSSYVHMVDAYPVSYATTDYDGVTRMHNFWLCFGVNETGTGFAEPVA